MFLAMLAALFSSWYTSGEPRYVSEEDTQKIAYEIYGEKKYNAQTDL
jgi:hypothetical protein